MIGLPGKPYTVIESGAILMYLAEKTAKFLPKDMAKKYDALQWLLFQTSNVGPNFGQFHSFQNVRAEGQADYHSHSMTRHQTEVKRLYEVMEKRSLANRFISAATNIRSPTSPHSPVDAQSRRPGREAGRQSEPGARWFKAIDL